MNQMLRTVFGLAALWGTLLGSSGGANAITFRSAFYGQIIWTAVSNCPTQHVGYTFTSEYHPRQPSPASENYSGITTMYTYDGAIYRLSGASFGSAFQPVTGIYSGTAGYTFTNAAVRITQTAPATVTPDTQFVSLRGQISSPWGLPGTNGQSCVVTFLATYFRGTQP